MTKATCSKCGYMVELTEKSPQGTDYWEIKDAIKFLIDKLEHDCSQNVHNTNKEEDNEQ